MTLRQLFNSVPFDRLVTFIKQSDQADDVCHYKQAYDILLHTEADKDGCCDITVSQREEFDGTKYISASQIEGCSWSKYIDGEVILEEGINVTNEELAFKLLWHLTFFGYSQEDAAENIGSLSNDEFHDTKYGEMARKIEHKRYMLWANKAIKKRIRESIEWCASQGMTSFGLSEEDWRYIDKRESHCNRMKRMRDHRLKIRQEELANLDRCENTIQRLLEGQLSNEVTRDDLFFLWYKRGRIGTELQTRAYDVSLRLSYFKELVDKYEALDTVKELDCAAIKISTSGDCPLADSESSFIVDKISKITRVSSLIVIVCKNNTLDQDVRVMVVGVTS